MKVKVDENLPVEIAAVWRQAGVDADTTLDEGLLGKPDTVVWGEACREDRTLVTQDVGLADTRTLGSRPHPGLILLRLRSDERQNLIDAAVSVVLAGRENDWSNTIAVVTEHKVRIRRSDASEATSED